MKQVVNRWTTLKQFEKKYSKGEYHKVDIGEYEINLQDIIALQRPHKELLQNDRIETLKKAYVENGGFYTVPFLLRAPNGKYAVTYESDLVVTYEQLGITKFKARIEVLIPNEYLTDQDQDIIKAGSEEKQIVENTIINLSNNRIKNKIEDNIRHPFYYSSVERYLSLDSNLIDSINKDLKQYFLRIAHRENLISDNEFSKLKENFLDLNSMK